MKKVLMMASATALLVAGAITADAASLAGPVEQDGQAMQAADHIGPATSIRQQIQTQLSKDGYTSVVIMPSSFLVRAKDKLGNPVEMVIGPDSFTEVTEVAPRTAAAPNTAPGPKTANGTSTGATTLNPAPKT